MRRHCLTDGNVLGGAPLTKLGHMSAVTRLWTDRSMSSSGRLVPLDMVPLTLVHCPSTVTMLRVIVHMALLHILCMLSIVLVSVLLLGSRLTPGRSCPMVVSRRLLASLPADPQGVEVSTSVLALS